MSILIPKKDFIIALVANETQVEIQTVRLLLTPQRYIHGLTMPRSRKSAGQSEQRN